MTTLLSHLSYIALTTPDVEASVDFYVNKVGLTEVAREDGKVYLRCWGDYYTYSLVIQHADEPSLATMAWRTTSHEALDEAVQRIEAAGVTGEWFDGLDIGRAYRFVGPWGHSMTLHWDARHFRYEKGELASVFPDRPQRRSRVAGAPRQLEQLGVNPWIDAVAESFVMLPLFVEHTERLAIIQRHLSPLAQRMGEVQVLELPFNAVPLLNALWWHPVHQPDPEHRWLREVFAAARIGFEDDCGVGPASGGRS